jgi:hypothetical protein
MGLLQLFGALTGRCSKGHKFGRWSTKKGWRTRACSRCGHTESRISLRRARATGAKRKQRRQPKR